MTSAMKLFIVEYSLTENATMIRTLEKVLEDNIGNVKNGQPKDYLPVGIFNSRQDAEQFLTEFLSVIVPEGELEFRSRNWKRISECLEAAFKKSLNQ